MSFAHEPAEQARPGAAAHRVLSHGDLIDIKYPVERALAVIPDLVIGLSSRGDTSGDALEDLATVVTALQIVQSNLDLDRVDDDDDDEPAEPIANVERLTRNGGRTDG